MKIKNLIFTLGCLLLLSGCWDPVPTEPIEDYNNRLITLQESAVDAMKSYYTSLNTGYDGVNLPSLYANLKQDLQSLSDQAQLLSGRGQDLTLRDGLIAYLSGLQSTLEQYELPIVEKVSSYSGTAQEFYQEDQQFISSTTMQLTQELAKLDQQFDLIHTTFAKKYKYELK